MNEQERQLLIKQLRYRTWHRGCKETDLLLGKFSDKYIEDFDDQQLKQLQAICDADDWDLYAWITDALPIPEAYDNEIMRMLKEFDCS